MKENVDWLIGLAKMLIANNIAEFIALQPSNFAYSLSKMTKDYFLQFFLILHQTSLAQAGIRHGKWGRVF